MWVYALKSWNNIHLIIVISRGWTWVFQFIFSKIIFYMLVEKVSVMIYYFYNWKNSPTRNKDPIVPWMGARLEAESLEWMTPILNSSKASNFEHRGTPRANLHTPIQNHLLCLASPWHLTHLSSEARESRPLGGDSMGCVWQVQRETSASERCHLLLVWPWPSHLPWWPPITCCCRPTCSAWKPSWTASCSSSVAQSCCLTCLPWPLSPGTAAATVTWGLGSCPIPGRESLFFWRLRGLEDFQGGKGCLWDCLSHLG